MKKNPMNYVHYKIMCLLTTTSVLILGGTGCLPLTGINRDRASETLSSPRVSVGSPFLSGCGKFNLVDSPNPLNPRFKDVYEFTGSPVREPAFRWDVTNLKYADNGSDVDLLDPKEGPVMGIFRLNLQDHSAPIAFDHVHYRDGNEFQRGSYRLTIAEYRFSGHLSAWNIQKETFRPESTAAWHFRELELYAVVPAPHPDFTVILTFFAQEPDNLGKTRFALFASGTDYPPPSQATNCRDGAPNPFRIQGWIIDRVSGPSNPAQEQLIQEREEANRRHREERAQREEERRRENQSRVEQASTRDKCRDRIYASLKRCYDNCDLLKNRAWDALRARGGGVTYKSDTSQLMVDVRSCADRCIATADEELNQCGR